MEFSTVIERRRSIRKFLPNKIPEDVIARALNAACLAPNSSNLQTWDFHIIWNQHIKTQLAHACMNQSAARTAPILMVITCNPDLWKRSLPEIHKFIETVRAPSVVHHYYKKLIPFLYSPGPCSILAPFKSIAAWITGLFRPIQRGPFTRAQLNEVAIKSAALAAENLILSLVNDGLGTCAMEGFDQKRVRKILPLAQNDQIVMIVAAGFEAERSTWGPQMRLSRELIIHEYK